MDGCCFEPIPEGSLVEWGRKVLHKRAPLNETTLRWAWPALYVEMSYNRVAHFYDEKKGMACNDGLALAMGYEAQEGDPLCWKCFAIVVEQKRGMS